MKHAEFGQLDEENILLFKMVLLILSLDDHQIS